MALFSEAMVPRDGTITLSDATGTPISMDVTYEDGDFTWDGMEEGYYNIEVFKDRGVPYSARKTDVQDLTWGFSAHATDFTDATEKTLMDACRKAGAWAAGVSKLGANADVWALQVKFTVERSNYGGTDNYVQIAKNRLNCGFAEGVPGKFSVKGRAILTDPTNDITWQ